MSFSNRVFFRLLAMRSFIWSRCLKVEPLEDRRLLAFEVESMFVVPPKVQLVDLIPLGADWKFSDDGSDQVSQWRQPADE